MGLLDSFSKTTRGGVHLAPEALGFVVSEEILQRWRTVSCQLFRSQHQGNGTRT